MSIVNTIQVPKMRRTRIKGRSHTFDFNCRIGELIPFLAEECVAGDIVKYGVESVIQFPALKKPLFSDGWKVDFFYFFSPYRILWKDWINFLPVHSTYNEDGTNITPSLPRVSSLSTSESSLDVGDSLPHVTQFTKNYDGVILANNAKFSIDDYLQASVPGISPYAKSLPIDLNHRAYLAIYQYFFRDENLDSDVWSFDEQSPIAVDKTSISSTSWLVSAGIQSRAWKKDYFTGGLPWIQKGVAPALPLYGSASAQLEQNRISFVNPVVGGEPPIYDKYIAELGSNYSGTNYYVDRHHVGSGDDPIPPVGTPLGLINKNVDVDLSDVTSADISELWTSMQIQKFLVRNAQVGTRYNEFLMAHYGVSPRDETLQRPIFLGSTSQPVFVSEVTQNSESGTTPQGTKTAKAISAGADYVGKYHVKEPGVLMGIMCISPKAVYTQGIDRFYLKDSPYDFYNRLFENLTDQPTYNAEIFLQNGDGTGDTDNRGTFNFMPRYCEYKIARDRVAGDLRDSLSMWHTGRIFASRPSFNSAFLHQGYSSLDRIFAVGGETRNCICHVVNKLDMLRPMSYLNMVGARI